MKMVKAAIIDPSMSKMLLRSLLSKEWLHKQQGAFELKRDVLQNTVTMAGFDQLQKVEVMLAELYPGELTSSGDSKQRHCGRKRKDSSSVKCCRLKRGKRGQNGMP
jgi:hypothetical protein